MNEIEYQTMFDLEYRHWWYRTLHDLILQFVKLEFRKKGPLEMFDAGCGTGGLMMKLARFGSVSGCDRSPEAIDLCRKRGLSQILLQDLNELRLPPESFDVINIIDVLYHAWIKSEDDVLARLFAALKPGGLLIVNDPAFEWLRGTHDIAVQTRARHTWQTRRAPLERAGFQIELLTYRLFFLFFPIVTYRAIQRLLHRREDPVATHSDVWMPPSPVNSTLRCLGSIENALLEYVNFPFGTSVFSIARKPS